MDELLEQFLIEGRELVAQASGDLAALRSDPGHRPSLDSAFRAIHTLKGSVAVFGLLPAERLLHAAEEVLQSARKGSAIFDPVAVDGLVACIDQTDRWIDDMERDGALPANAQAASDRTVALLSQDPNRPERDTPATLDWVAALAQREAAAIGNAHGPVVAFRYTPDADCFFRGEDPLSVVEAVPELVALALMPNDGVWPDARDLEPFACFSALEGLSLAVEADVRAAFRFQPAQVAYSIIQPTAPEPTTGHRRDVPTLMRVDAARIDALADGFGDLVVAINALGPLVDQARANDNALAARIQAVQATIERATGKLHRNLNAVRLVPLEPSLRRLPRMAREIAETLGKPMTLTITGDRIEVDKQVADGLFEPLLHLVRNAIDHGLEAPERRAASGKVPDGRITLDFRREGDNLVVSLEDDGAGIDPALIRDRACQHGVITREAADALADATALRLILAPGFSTASAITEVSGRGVGMDAVRDAIEKMRGSIEIESEAGRGTVFRMFLPANALTTRLLVVEVGGERFGIKLDQIIETVRIGDADLIPVGRGHACVLRDRTIPVLDLAALIDARPPQGRHARLIVTQASGEPVALRIDQFGERIDTVVRPTTGLLALSNGISGSALMGDGSVLLVLDLAELAA